MPELIELFNDEDAYNINEWTSQWINVTSSNNLVFTAYTNQTFDIGVRWAVNDDYFVISETIESVPASESYELFVPVIARFVQFFIQNIGALPAEIRTQGFFYVDANGVPDSGGGGTSDITLSSVGGFSSLVVGATGPNLSVKSLQSSNTSVTITENADNIDLTIGAVPSTIWQQVGAQIKPITATQTSLIGGINNNIDSTTREAFVWGDSNYTKPNSGFVDTLFIGGSTNCGTTGAFGGGGCSNLGMLFCTDCEQIVEGNLGRTENTCIIASTNSRTYDAGGGDRSCKRSAIIACENASIGGTGSVTRDSLQCMVAASENCVMDNYCGTCCSGIIFSHECEVGNLVPGGNEADQLFILGCTGCTLGAVDNANRTTDSIISSSGCLMYGTVKNSTIYGSNNCTMYGVNPSTTNSIINCTNSNLTAVFGNDCSRNAMINTKSTNAISDDSTYINCSGVTGTHNGNFIVGDSLLGFSSEINNQCLMKFTNGYKLYTGALTGMVAGAGANSFSAICQRSKKENIHEIEYQDILEKVNNIPLYQYNYIGNNPTQKNISPMAEDWHDHFGFLDGGLKSNEVIETMDAIGVALCSIKALNEQVKDNNGKFEYFVRESISDDLKVLKTLEHIQDETDHQLETVSKYVTDKYNEMDNRINELNNKLNNIKMNSNSSNDSDTITDLLKEIKNLKDRVYILENQH